MLWTPKGVEESAYKNSFGLSMEKLNIIILIVYLVQISSSEVIVETKSGPIRGKDVSADVVAFLGIPFAERPVGDLRFAKPVPKQPWTETYNASSLPPSCLQKPPPVQSLYFIGNVSDMSEDCLYLNIWTPKTKKHKDLRPVIIYIHPGSFSYGSSSQNTYEGTHLVSLGDVIVVTINYRMGTFGFLLAYIEEADGNMGMYDHLMAVQWIKDNAEAFGGDPDNIVLMGSSAGALSVGVYMVSPLSQNLFRKAILTSGSIINPMFLNGNDALFKNFESIASMAGCTNKTSTLRSDPRSVVKCLKAKPAEVLLDADYTLMKFNPLVFYPRVGDQLLPKEAGLMFRDGKFSRDIDVLYGTATNEGSILLIGAMHDYIGAYGTLSIGSMTKSRAARIGRFVASLGGIKNASEQINFYIKTITNETPEEYLQTLSRAVGDFAIACGTVFLSDFLSLKGNRVYFYKIGFRAALTPMAEWVETTHLDDLQYIFGNPYHGNFTAEEVELSHRLIARISSFAKTGNPNVPEEVPWQPYSYHKPLYLYIGQDGESVRLKPNDRCDIWRKEFKSEIGPDLIEFFKNSGKNSTDEADSSTY